MKTAGEILEAWTDIRITAEVAAEGITEFLRVMELSSAVWLARIFEPERVHRYVHTKKSGPARNTKSGSWPGFGRCSGKC